MPAWRLLRDKAEYSIMICWQDREFTFSGPENERRPNVEKGLRLDAINRNDRLKRCEGVASNSNIKPRFPLHPQDQSTRCIHQAPENPPPARRGLRYWEMLREERREWNCKALENVQRYLGNSAERCKERKARSGLEVKKLLGLPMRWYRWLRMIPEKKTNPKPTMKTGRQEASGSPSNLTEYPPEPDVCCYWEERMNFKMLLSFLVTCEIILISHNRI